MQFAHSVTLTKMATHRHTGPSDRTYHTYHEYCTDTDYNTALTGITEYYTDTDQNIARS